MVVSRSDILKVLQTVQEQQQQFLETTELCSSDGSIPIAFTKDNRVHIGPKMEMRVVALGLDGAGKTSILFKLKQDEFVSTITTIGKPLSSILQVYVPQNTTQFSIIHILCHKYISWAIIGFLERFSL